MTVMRHAAPRPAFSFTRAWRWFTLGLLLAAVAAVLVTLALRPPQPEHPATGVEDGVDTSASPASPTSPASPASPTRTPSSAPGPVALPEYLSIPAIGVATDLVRLGLQPDRTVEVPQDAARAGWFDEGPPPGQPGASVVLGHVDSVEGPAVFYRLAQLRPGDRVQVSLSDGSVARFAVRRVATFANDDFPSEQVYAGNPVQRTLNLVTCGGWYDADLGGWQGNVVVFTELVPRARASQRSGTGELPVSASP